MMISVNAEALIIGYVIANYQQYTTLKRIERKLDLLKKPESEYGDTDNSSSV